MNHTEITLLVSSVRNDEMEAYFSDIDELTARHEREVGFIVIDEMSVQEGSTVVDMTGLEPEIIRQGAHGLRE